MLFAWTKYIYIYIYIYIQEGNIDNINLLLGKYMPSYYYTRPDNLKPKSDISTCTFGCVVISLC